MPVDFDYQEYLASREWAVRREAVRMRCGGICERCNKSPMYAAHHLTYERIGRERLEDLQGLCKDCHRYQSAKSDYDPADQFNIFLYELPFSTWNVDAPQPSRLLRDYINEVDRSIRNMSDDDDYKWYVADLWLEESSEIQSCVTSIDAKWPELKNAPSYVMHSITRYEHPSTRFHWAPVFLKFGKERRDHNSRDITAVASKYSPVWGWDHWCLGEFQCRRGQ